MILFREETARELHFIALSERAKKKIIWRLDGSFKAIGIAPLSLVQLPWLGLIFGEIYLLTKVFDTTFLAMLQSKFRKQR